MILGLHASVRRGHLAALAAAREHGCEALQILPYRRHHPPTPAELAEFRAARAASGVRTLLVHSRFVPNPASSNEERRLRSAEHLAEELRLCDGLGGEAYVLHAGAYSPDSDSGTGIRLFAETVRLAVEEAEFSGSVFLENVPGGGRRMGGTLEELARLLEAVGRFVPRAAACLDTAHAWAAGYDLASAEGALQFVASARRLLGAGAVRAFHLNDSLALRGSNREHHWHWGQGRLGVEGLTVLLKRPEFAVVPGILETPNEAGADAANLALVRGLAA